MEAGKIADLVLLDGNPQESIGNTKRIAAVVCAGHFFDRAGIDAMLANVEAVANSGR